MKRGICLKCSTATVYEAENGVVSEVGISLLIQATTGSRSVSGTTVHTYVCTSCGYLENYLTPLRFEDVKKSAAWKKVG
jgi:hypothetical protein